MYPRQRNPTPMAAIGFAAITLGVAFWLLILVILLLVAVAHAAPPENADPALAPWFHSLRHPRLGGCCDTADGRVTSMRVVGDHYEVLIDGKFPGVTTATWEVVPPDAILERQDNPTGGTVVFWYMHAIRCVVLPAGT